MPVPVTAFAANSFPTAKALDIDLYTSDGTADNPAGIAFLAYRPILFESYTRSATFSTAAGGTQSSMSTSGSITTCQVVYDTAGYYGQTSDLPGTGYYALTSVIDGAAGDGQTPGGWMILSHLVPLTGISTQTSVSADLQQVAGAAVSGARQAPAGTSSASAPFFADLVNVGTSTFQPALTVRDSAGTAASLRVNATDPSGQTPRFYGVWAAVSASTTGQAVYATAGTYTFTAPAGVDSIVVPQTTGAGAGGGAGNVSVGGVEYGAGGGGGGETSGGTVAVTPGNNYPVTVGAGGVAGTSPGGNGGAGGLSSFAGDSVTVTGHGGAAGLGATTSADGTGGAGGTGSSATTHHDGGAGADGTTAVDGGGGGSSAGTGQAGTAAMGADGGDAPADGGPGGDGGTIAITVVQTASGTKSNAGSFSLNFSAPIQAGNTVVAAVSAQSYSFTNAPTANLSDGTVMTQQVSANILGNGGVSVNLAVLDVYNVKGGETGVTVTNIGSSDRVFCVQMWEIAGLGTSPTVDVNSSATAQSSKYSASSPTNQAPEIWIGTVATTKNSGHSVNAPSGSWTAMAQTGGSGSGIGGSFTSHMRSGYQLVTAAGTMKYNGTISASIYWADAVISYASSAVTSGTAPVTGPGGGGGGGLGGSGDGAAGADGYVKLTWTGVSGSGYGTPPLPAPYAAWSSATQIGTTNLVDVDINSAAGITNVVNFLCNPPIVRVQGTSAQSIANASVVAVTFSGGTTSVDSYTGYASGTYTVARAGIYLFHGLVCFAANSTGTRQAGATINGTTYWGPGYKATTSGTTNATKTQIFSLQAGDTVTLAARQDSGGSLNLATTDATRFFMTWLCASGLPVQPWTPPDATFRWSSGTPGSLLPAQFQAHLGNDLGFLVNRPYLLAYQTVAQSSLTVGSFSTLTLDTVGGVVHNDTGDSYSGWTPGPSNLYTAPVAGWYLMAGEYFCASSAAAGAAVTAGILPSTSGGATPHTTPDSYQELSATSTASVGGGATVLGLQYCSAGETITPQVRASAYAAPYATLTGVSNSGYFYPHLSLVWVSE